MLPSEDRPALTTRVKRLVVGPPRDLADKSIFHRLALVPLLAWVGLGADGLSSSSYGPEEAFRTLETHGYLAIGLAAMTVLTVFVIASAYSRIIEEFPQGGGGYLVATKLLGPRAGVVSGCALLVDYVMTITVSIAAAGEAIFSFLPPAWVGLKLPAEAFFIIFLIALNIRGVRESVIALAPIFFLFLITHVVLIGGGLIAHVDKIPATARSVTDGFSGGLHSMGMWGMFLLFVHAYSMGGGTYTGLEAVSNGMPIMREPRVQTGKRTMLYMAASLSLTAGGLLVCYLLWNVSYEHGKTMNAVLAERFAGNWPMGGRLFIVLTLFSEGALLVVGAQAGFIDGPRILANMAVDSWMPRRFAALSDRLTTANGVMLMGVSSLLALWYTRGDVRALVIMYSINVFLTFSLSMLGMSRLWLAIRRGQAMWKRRSALFVFGFLLCAVILVFTVYEKFTEGGWITLLITGGAVVLCFMIRAHYQEVSARLVELYAQLPQHVQNVAKATAGEPDPSLVTAALLVGGYSGIGIHSLLSIFRNFPGCFKGIVFLSVGVVDSGGFKGEGAVESLQKSTKASLEKYVAMARGLGIPATYRMATGTDAVEEAEKLCVQLSKEFSRTTFFAGKLIFARESWYQRILHNETAVSIQQRLHFSGLTMVVLPARMN
jgi:amino acid transporter